MKNKGEWVAVTKRQPQSNGIFCVKQVCGSLASRVRFMHQFEQRKVHRMHPT